MSPRLPANDIADLYTADAVGHRERCLWNPAGVQRADGDYIGFGQLCHSVLFTDEQTWIGASLVPHIVRIVGGCSQKEMVRSNTATVIALMADEQSSRNWAEGPYPDQPVCIFDFSVEAEYTVTIPSSAQPFPTLTGFVDFLPESFSDRPGLRTSQPHKRIVPGF